MSEVCCLQLPLALPAQAPDLLQHSVRLLLWQFLVSKDVLDFSLCKFLFLIFCEKLDNSVSNSCQLLRLELHRKEAWLSFPIFNAWDWNYDLLCYFKQCLLMRLQVNIKVLLKEGLELLQKPLVAGDTLWRILYHKSVDDISCKLLLVFGEAFRLDSLLNLVIRFIL